MNEYVCPGAWGFVRRQALPIHVDVTGLLVELNRRIAQGPRVVFDCRPPGFGKTWACDMLCAYYDWSVDGLSVFKDLDIAEDPSFNRYRNRYEVIRLDMAELFAHERDYELGAQRVQMLCGRELMMQHPNARVSDYRVLVHTMEAVYLDYQRPFVVVIDNWDEPLRQAWGDEQAQRAYGQLLRTLIHSRNTALAYLTGIVPPSAFWGLFTFDIVELSNITPGSLGPYRGLRIEQVEALCRWWGGDIDEIRAWYGDRVASNGEVAFSPSSALASLSDGGYRCRRNLYDRNEPYAELINPKISGMPIKLAMLLANGSVSLNLDDTLRGSGTFLSTDTGQLELLVHMGCLAFDSKTSTVHIPNKEAYELLEQLIGLSKKLTYPFGDTRWKDYHKDRRCNREKLAVSQPPES